MRERLLDWSKYQGQTNLKDAVDAWNIVGLMARCTIGYSYRDPFYDHNHAQARDLGILFGAYHVLWPWNRNPLKEADWFRKSIPTDGDLPDFAVDDIELPANGDTDGWKRVTPKEVGQQIVVQLPAIKERTGLAVLAYSNSSWWDNPLRMGLVTPLGVEGEYPLIEAEYPIQKPCGKLDWNLAPEAPRMPSVAGGWQTKDVVMWQWTSCLKPIGVKSASQDANVLIPTYDQFLVMLGIAEPPLTYQEKVDLLWAAHKDGGHG